MITVTRRYRFSASHRLHLRSLSNEANQQLYGKCNNPFGHGHDYVLEVTCEGRVNERTGLLLDGAQLDRLVEEQVLRAFAFRDLNHDVPEFSELVPTTENIAAVIVQRLRSKWPGTMGNAAHLLRVHVQETDRNGFEILLGSLPNASETESAGPMESERVSNA